MEFYQAIDLAVQNMAASIEEKGAAAVTAGCNGPYHNVETEVRNRAHWCVTFSEYYRATKEEKYLGYVRLLADSILGSPCYNGKGVYLCREKGRNDEVNGVIGPAWIIEGLVYAYRATGEERYLDRAIQLFQVVPFSKDLGIWNRLNTQNETLSVDVTFNHQLWFAAAGAMLLHEREDAGIRQELARFVDRLPRNMAIRPCGRVAHFTSNNQNGYISRLTRIYRDIKSDLQEKAGKPSMAYKETGYDLFVLYGLAILRENYDGEIPFLKTKKFQMSIDYICSDNFLQAVTKADRGLDGTNVKSELQVDYNLFGFAYNSPAFEWPRCAAAFGVSEDLRKARGQELAAFAMDRTFDEAAGGFFAGTDDPVTLNTRCYELIAENSDFEAWLSQRMQGE